MGGKEQKIIAMIKRGHCQHLWACKEMPEGTAMEKSPKDPEEVLVGNRGRLLGFGQMEGWRWTDGQRDQQRKELLEGWVDRRMDGRITGWMEQSLDERMDGSRGG